MDKHLEWAKRLCCKRECCAQEVRLKLKKQGIDPKEIERMITALIKENYINEDRYVCAFVHDKSVLQGWGPEKIRYSLHCKQIQGTLIQEALAGLDVQSQKGKLLHLLQTKQRSIKATSALDIRSKLILYGLARGYSYEDILSLLPLVPLPN